MAGAGIMSARSRRASFGFIFACSLVNSISFGLMIPVLPNLIKAFTGGDTASASEWNVLFSVVWGVMQLFFGPLLGMLSDRVGRRPILLLSIFGLAVDFFLMAFAPSLMWLLAGRVLNGMTAASFSTANAYVADVTAPEERAKTFGMMGASFSVGFICGPAIGGWLAGFDLRAPFLVAGALCAINWLYGFFILPESLPPERRTSRLDWGRANPIGALGFLRSHNALLGLAGIGFLYQLAHTVLPSIFVLYSGYRYGWSAQTVGLTMLLTGISGLAVQALLVGPVVSRLGERGTLLLGVACGAGGFLIYALAPTGLFYLLGIPVFAGINFVQPGLQGLMTQRVSPQSQGQLQGANQALQGVASVLGPMIFGLTFAWSIREAASFHAPGLAIGLASVMLVCAFGLALRFAQPRHLQG